MEKLEGRLQQIVQAMQKLRQRDFVHSATFVCEQSVFYTHSAVQQFERYEK